MFLSSQVTCTAWFLVDARLLGNTARRRALDTVSCAHRESAGREVPDIEGSRCRLGERLGDRPPLASAAVDIANTDGPAEPADRWCDACLSASSGRVVG